MQRKKQIDNNIRKYVRSSLDKGYSKESIKKSLINSGYDELYSSKITEKTSQTRFVRNYSLFMLIAIFVGIFYFKTVDIDDNILTGNVISQAEKSRYFQLNVKHFNGSLSLNELKIVNLNNIIGQHYDDGFLIKVLSKESDELYSMNYLMIDNKNYLVFIPYYESAERILFYYGDKKVMEVNLKSFI